MDGMLRLIRKRLSEDEGGWDYYDDHPYDAIHDLRTLVRMLAEEGR